MLRLKEIKREGNLLSAIYDPEATGILGRVCINIHTKSPEDCVISKYENAEYPDYYYHALKALRNIVNEDDIPAERLVMWY